MPTQLEYNLAKEPMRLNRIKMTLLNYQFQQIGDLTGDLIDSPSFTIDANSDIRRTCSVRITPRDSSFDIKQGNKIWLDKYVQILMIQKSISGEEEYTNMGIYLINNPQRVYSITENSLTFQGVDLMARFTGLRNGNLQGMPYLIPQGSNVRSAIIAVLELCGFNKYVVEECEVDVPNDINIKIGGTVYDILKALRDILPNYQMYFDVDGTFHYNKIPSGKNEQIMVDDDIWKYNLLDYQKSTSFETLKNSIEVFGKTHDIKNYGGDAVINGDTYEIFVSNIKELRRNTKIGFSTNTDVGELKYLQVTTERTTVSSSGAVDIVKDVAKYPIRTSKGIVPKFNTEENTYYVVNFTYGIDQWDFASQDLNGVPLESIISEDTYIVSDKSYTLNKYENGMTITFRTPKEGCDTLYLPYLRLNNLTKFPINNIVKLRNDTVYTVKLNLQSEDTSQKYFQFMGELTPYAKIQEDNPESPYWIHGTVGVINQVFSGGEYDKIYTSDLAMERAKWELYQKCRLQDNVTINCIPIYWLDVNWLIEITLPNRYGEETKELYIIKSINIGSGANATQSVTLMKYYPYYDYKD